MKRDVTNNHMRVGWQTVSQKIFVDDSHSIVKFPPQRTCQRGVNFNSCERSSRTRQRMSQRSLAGTNLNQGAASASHTLQERGDNAGVSEKVLAVFVTTTRICRYGMLRKEEFWSRVWQNDSPA